MIWICLVYHVAMLWASAGAVAGTRQLPAAKQGPHAWLNASSRHSSFGLTGVNRLVCHAVQDDTALRKYIPRVRDFLVWGLSNRRTQTRTLDHLDELLADFLAHACYVEHRNFDYGSTVYFGLIALFPEFAGRLPRSYRAYTAWKRLHVPGEGQPIPEELIFVIAERLRAESRFESAMIVETCFDLYLRQGEWTKIRACDVVDDGRTVAFVLGIAERGERVKTGRNQGVCLDSVVLRDEWRRLLQSKKSDELVFTISAAEFLADWNRIIASLGVKVGPPHDLRHSGAARDVAEKTRSLEEVRRRGRWRAPDSVQRYTKTWLLVRARAAIPEQLRKRGRDLVMSRGCRDIRN